MKITPVLLRPESRSEHGRGEARGLVATIADRRARSGIGPAHQGPWTASALLDRRQLGNDRRAADRGLTSPQMVSLISASAGLQAGHPWVVGVLVASSLLKTRPTSCRCSTACGSFPRRETLPRAAGRTGRAGCLMTAAYKRLAGPSSALPSSSSFAGLASPRIAGRASWRPSLNGSPYARGRGWNRRERRSGVADLAARLD